MYIWWTLVKAFKTQNCTSYHDAGSVTHCHAQVMHLQPEPCHIAPLSAGGDSCGWLYCVKLKLTDATGELEAFLFGSDGQTFFQVTQLV